jgi:hypothetical protein
MRKFIFQHFVPYMVYLGHYWAEETVRNVRRGFR